MTLDTYLHRNRISGAEFARKLKVSASAVSYWRRGGKPKLKMVEKIIKITDGKVRGKDLRSELERLTKDAQDK